MAFTVTTFNQEKNVIKDLIVQQQSNHNSIMKVIRREIREIESREIYQESMHIIGLPKKRMELKSIEVTPRSMLPA